MGEGRHVGETERGRAALDGVGGTEHDVDQFRIVGTLVQREERLLHGVEAVEAFLVEGLVELRQIDFGHGGTLERPYVVGMDQPSTRATVASSWSGSNGLTSQPVAPAALPSIFLLVSDSVVSMRMGTPL